MHNWTINNRELSSPKAGVCRVNNRSASGSVVLPLYNSDIRSPLMKGDGIHALPYWRRIVYDIVDTGQLSLDCFSAFAPPPACAGVGTWRTTVTGSTPAVFWPPVPPKPPLSPIKQLDEFLIGSSTTKALANARRSYNNIPLLIADRRGTVELIVRRSKHLVKLGSAQQREALAKFARAAKRDKRRVASEIAKTHLEFLFGVMPLIGEIEGLCDQLSQESSSFITGRGRMRDVATYPRYDKGMSRAVDTGGGILPDLRTHCRAFLERNASTRTSLRYRIDISSAQKLRDNGFNPIATAYDLVPLSFLSEFVSNLGSFLRAYDPMFGATYVTGSTSIFYEEVEQVDVTGKDYYLNPWRKAVIGKQSVKAAGKYVRRIVHDKPPEPVLMWQNNLTPGKLATVAALAVQRYLKPLKALIKVREFRYRGPRPRNLPPIRYRRQ